ncbi:hypothetical protein J40TS1_06530 [Paenibacillus montaniterrae]|uniref:Cytosolic protein n=1 Tax=Paenibacillus montaniterrae TaxID=429341 RepID=A0A919YPI4_9BACL|nr:hypothetical protein [Paenibacillus montaniterrae]GIP15011.1 hypothetical protein J40TS1_06530 [Paenibacillus montaniterrae]
MSKEEGFLKEDRQKYTDLATVESQRNDLTAEEFTDGPYGSPTNAEMLGKSTPWRIDQRPPNRFDYENREYHSGKERDYPDDQGQGNAAIDTFNEPESE